jgi:hypothetical protein
MKDCNNKLIEALLALRDVLPDWDWDPGPETEMRKARWMDALLPPTPTQEETTANPNG